MNKNQNHHLIFYGGLAVLYLILLTGWWLGNGASLRLQASGIVPVARLFGLMAGFSVLLQVFLMSRVPLVDQRFNLHEIVRLHRWNGYAVVGFISIHISLMTLGYAAMAHAGLWTQFVQLVTTFRDVFKALLAAILIFFAVAVSIGASRRRLPYEFWYYIHLTLYIAILLAFFHQVNTGSDILAGGWFRYFWLSLYVFVFGIWSYFRGSRIVLMALRHRFAVDRIVQEADGIYSVYIKGRNLKNFSFEPGQYAGWRVLSLRLVGQSHPYSFSDTPGKSTLRFTINTADGAFTSAVPQLKPGITVFIDGPRGSFTTRRVTTKRVVLVAGGIGVAPYLSLIPDLLKTGHSVTLLYAARAPENCAFGDELRGLEKSGLDMQYFVSSKSQRIDENIINSYADTDTTFYLCGPDPMVVALTETLQRLDIPSDRIVKERFSV